MKSERDQIRDKVEFSLASIPEGEIVFIQPQRYRGAKYFALLADSLKALSEKTGMQIVLVPYGHDLYSLGAKKMPSIFSEDFDEA